MGKHDEDKSFAVGPERRNRMAAKYPGPDRDAVDDQGGEPPALPDGVEGRSYPRRESGDGS